MSAGAHDLLFEALERRFDDGSRSAVVVLGAGLHHHIRAQSLHADASAWRYLTNWNGLLAEVADEFRLPAVLHADPAATWESLVTRIAYFKKTQKSKATGVTQPVSKAEAMALDALARKLEDVPADPEVLRTLGRGLAQYRDVVSLNIDPTLDLALGEAGASCAHPEVHAELRSLCSRTHWTHGRQQGRVWQPHGTVRVPKAIVLGTRAYGRSLEALHRAWDAAKNAETCHPHVPKPGTWSSEDAVAWWSKRRGLPPYEPQYNASTLRLTWLDLFLGSDLVFIGTGLDRAETDLWWALHMRQRNLARVAPSERPGTFALFAKGQCPEHLTTGPAGVLPVTFQSWNDAWEMVFPDAWSNDV